MLVQFKPNKYGYTLMAEGRSSTPIPPCKWGLRTLSYPDLPVDADKGAFSTNLNALPVVLEVMQPVRTRKTNVLFRFAFLCGRLE